MGQTAEGGEGTPGGLDVSSGYAVSEHECPGSAHRPRLASFSTTPRGANRVAVTSAL